MNSFTSNINESLEIQFTYSHLRRENYIYNNQSCINLKVELKYINTSIYPINIALKNEYIYEFGQRRIIETQKFHLAPKEEHICNYTRLLGFNDKNA